MTDFSKAYEAAKKHARRVYPEESCGFIVGGEYIALQNTAADPAHHKEDDRECSCRLCSFKISNTDHAKYVGKIDMVIHSHPNHAGFPSRADMVAQVDMNVPWGIIALDEERIGDPEIWGDTLPVPPLLGREFMHGIRDCYSLIRDTYRLGRGDLIEQGITTEWPFEPILLKEVPRDDAWWEGEDDFYGALPPSHGWMEIKQHEARPGDVFLLKIRSNKLNHAGVLIGKDLIMHHLPGRFSRREPAGIWARSAEKWLRYVGEGADA